MGLKAMLTVDLNNDVSSKQRDDFNKALENEGWSKITSLTTTWQAGFKDGVGRSGAIGAAKKDVQTAAKKAGVSSYDAAVMVGDEFPEVF